MSKTLFILGAGGHGRVVADISKSMIKWDEIYFLDDNQVGKSIIDILVIDSIENTSKYINKKNEFIIAFGDNKKRQEYFDYLKEKGAQITKLIHPTAVISKNVEIAEGTVVMPGVVINTMTVIGVGSIINTNSTVEHDGTIDSFVHISPGSTISGSVTIGRMTWIGAGTTIINNILIGEQTVVGAGSLVLRNIPQKTTAYGVPAKVIKRLQ